MENEKLITVLTVAYIHEMAVIRSILEAEGIFYFVKDEFTVQVAPHFSNMIGGARLQVLEKDLSQVNEILEEDLCTTKNDIIS